MIDQHGNKIQPQGKPEPDPARTLAELRFMMKGFQKNPSAQSAMRIAQKLTAVTKIDDIVLPIEDEIVSIIDQLESYSVATKNHSLCWELVYSLRNISDYNNSINLPDYGFKYRQRAVRIFEEICKINPSTHNKCCKIIESSASVFFYMKANADFESASKTYLDILFKEEECFKTITEKTKMYFKAGRYLYKNMYFIYKALKDHKNCLIVAKNTAYYSREIYLLDKSNANLDQYLTDYAKYALVVGYSYSDNELEFNEMFALAEEFDQSLHNERTQTILNVYKKLRDLLIKL